jgi:hypothetical protein
MVINHSRKQCHLHANVKTTCSHSVEYKPVKARVWLKMDHLIVQDAVTQINHIISEVLATVS